MSDERTGFGVVHRSLAGRLTGAELAVYVALSWHADGSGECWPSHATIAEEAGISVSTAQRALTGLRDKGVVVWVPRVGEDGGRSSNGYRLVVFGFDRTPGHDDRPPQSQGPTPSVCVTEERDSLNETNEREEAPSDPPVRKRPRGTRVPEPFTLTEDMLSWARSKVPGLDVIEATEEFVDYWRGVPGQRGVKLDWTATWRNDMKHKHSRARPTKAKSRASDPVWGWAFQ